MFYGIVGSRDYPMTRAVRDFVMQLDHAKDAVVTGGARGVDSVAEQAAKSRRLRRFIYEPQCWPGAPKHVYVRSLFARNKDIVDASDVIVAFWDGKSRGTQHTIEQARAAGKQVRVFGPDGREQT